MNRCSLVHPLSIVQLAKNTSQIIVWEVNASVDLMTAHRTNFDLHVTNEMSDVKGAFDLDGSLFIAHAVGIWHVNILLFSFTSNCCKVMTKKKKNDFICLGHSSSK